MGNVGKALDVALSIRFILSQNTENLTNVNLQKAIEVVLKLSYFLKNAKSLREMPGFSPFGRRPKGSFHSAWHEAFGQTAILSPSQ